MESKKNYKIYSVGENAITIDFGNFISPELNEFVTNLADLIENNKFEGFIECLTAYSSLTVFYDSYQVRKSEEKLLTAFETVKSHIENQIEKITDTKSTEKRIIEIPVSFDEKFALDLDFVAKTNKLEKKEVLKIFLSKTYRVFMLGFLPGFAYMGELDERIATPRKKTPRTKIPKGSVGIAGKQTGIYPLESPGGWQIVGKTDIELFTPNDNSPTYLNAGDLIKFKKVK